jgi:hypothetical protein
LISRISTVCCAAASNCCCFRDPWLFCRRIYFASPYQWLAVLRLASQCSCFAVKAMPTDPWGQPLTPGPRFALQACSALLCAPLPMAWLANCKPMHGRYLWCVVAWPIWLGSSSPAGPTGHSRQLFLAHLRRVANQNKQPARPCSHQEKSLRPKLQRPKHADIAPACCCKFNFGGR